jgi:hypothetical protein
MHEGRVLFRRIRALRIRRNNRCPCPSGVACRAATNAANVASTARSRRRSTGSNALSSTASETKSRIVAGGESRVNSGAWNKAAVGTCTPGSASTYQAGGRSIGVRISPTPSAHALSPRTNTGTVGAEREAQFREPVHAQLRCPTAGRVRSGPSPRRRIRRRTHRLPECVFRRRCRHQARFRLIGAIGCTDHRSSALGTPGTESPTRDLAVLAHRSRTVSPQSRRRKTVCSGVVAIRPPAGDAQETG